MGLLHSPRNADDGPAAHFAFTTGNSSNRNV